MEAAIPLEEDDDDDSDMEKWGFRISRWHGHKFVR